MVFTHDMQFVIRLSNKSGKEGDFPVLAWEMDEDGTGCAIVVLPDAVIVRTDRLEHEGWKVLGLTPVRVETGPRLQVPV